MNELLNDAAARATRYLDGLDARRVAPTPEALADLKALDGPLPEEPTDPAAVLALLDDFGSPATAATAGQRFFGYVIGGSLPVTLAANWLAGAWDQPAFAYTTSPIAATLEEIALPWLLDVLGLPEACGGAFVTGTAIANFCGLAAARHSVLEKAGWNVEADGLFGAPPVTVVVGAEAHPTLFRALGLLGLGHQRAVTVPVDS